MGNVLKSDASSADAWAQVDLGSGHADTWETWEQYFTSDVLAFWTSEFSGNLCALLAADETTRLDAVSIFGGQWYGNDVGAIVSPAPAAGAWVTVELHRVANISSDIYIAGALAGSGVDGSATGTRFVRIGQDQAAANDGEITYCKNLKVGTTRGASDLFAWPDTETDLSAWTSTSGAVSVVADPAITAPAAPTLDSAVRAGSVVTLDWTPGSDGGSVITGYNIYRGTAPDGESLLDTVGDDPTTYEDGTVDPDTTYYYEVTAVNAIGESDPSNELAAAPPPTLAISTAPGLVPDSFSSRRTVSA